MIPQIVYLAGPITGLSYKETTSWREWVKARLESHGIYKCLSPMRGKQQFADTETHPAVLPDNTDGLYSNKAEFLRDRYDVHRADVVLANLYGAKRVSVFTVMEMGWAFQAGKFVLTVMEPGNIHDHLCIRCCSSLVVPTLAEAVGYLEGYLNA